MLSQRTVIWVGAAASAVVAAGAGAVVWTHPELLRLSPAAAPPVVASAPAEPKPASAPKAPPAVEAAAPAGDKSSGSRQGAEPGRRRGRRAGL